ncbi:hypothetical protein PoB_000424500 [Plakobranchus ocellatus]|uniref:Uncharacterized protein n=1 Tax=Plakobranchus ocellatus TaxID=259542 RepID=A0AAV3Y500_9GAST|nr:hypothetical protein PoB_000424500 [Plakobranchus ocellatus]
MRTGRVRVFTGLFRRQREGAAPPDVVTLTDCHAFVQVLGGPDREGMEEVVLLADYLQKTEDRRTAVQLLQSYVKVIGNEIVDGLANQGKAQPRKPSTSSDVRSTLRRGTAELWGAAQLSNDERLPKLSEVHKANDYLQGLHRSDAMQIFRAKRGTHSSSRTERDAGWVNKSWAIAFGDRTGGKYNAEVPPASPAVNGDQALVFTSDKVATPSPESRPKF